MTNFINLAITFIGIQSTVYSGSVLDRWHTFKLQHRKQYKTVAEENFRMLIYLNNLKRIRDHNQWYEQGVVSYKLKENRFADMLHDELMDAHEGHWFEKVALVDTKTFSSTGDDLPESVDWLDQGAVTPVKDQGRCGSCWSFVTIGALEGQNFRSTGELVSLSEQNLIDCSGEYGNNGCDGGNPFLAFSYISDNGINSEESYPYEGKVEECRFDSESSLASISGVTVIPSGDEEKLKAAVATVGPIASAIDTHLLKFRFYSEGVYNDPECASGYTDLDHAVLIIGYGTTDDGLDYWILKNSWGTDYGQDGYILISRNQDNHCGIATAAIFPVLSN